MNLNVAPPGPRLMIAALLLTGLSLVGPQVSQAAEPLLLRIGHFSKLSSGHPLPEQWKPLTFKKIERHTLYRVVDDSGISVIKAESHASASGLIRKVSINPRKFPHISWRWKVSSVYSKGDVSRKSGDDYPARIYITFAYDPDRAGFFEKAKYKAARLIYGETPPLAAITYIWANRAPVDSIVESAYTNRSKMIVLQSGAARTSRWVTEKRNVYADYKRAFGKEPPMISGVAIMTDSDNTGESAAAWYGDIVFSAE